MDQVPASLDWISYDFYRLNNVSWLQPQCEYHQNLYPKFSSPHQRALLLPGGWGSTSGPRGGAGQFKYNCSACPSTPQCTVEISMSCTSDPFSCSNIKVLFLSLCVSFGSSNLSVTLSVTLSAQQNTARRTGDAESIRAGTVSAELRLSLSLMHFMP